MIKKLLSVLVLILLPITVSAGDLRKIGSTSNIIRFVLKRADTGQYLTGLTYNSAGLSIYVSRSPLSTTTTNYTQAAGNIEDIAVLGTYQTPSSSKCRFKETGIPGVYEFHFNDGFFEDLGSTHLVITVTGASNLLTTSYEIQLVKFDPQTNVWDETTANHQTAGTFGAVVQENNQGTGDTAVDENSGGTDNLRYVYQGSGIDNADIKAYLKTDYDAGHKNDAYVKGWSKTKVDGRWQWPMYLDHGFTYTFTFYKQGAYKVTTKEVTIP